MYPNLESFKKNYYDIIFAQKRECNLQSWISDENSNTYWVTFIEDIMATGNYDNVEKFEEKMKNDSALEYQVSDIINNVKE